MKYRRLGRTGLRVSEISLGTVEIGMDYGLAASGEAKRPEQSEAARLLNRALDLGINFLDTARAYGESEALIGRILRERRDEFLICSKVAAASEQDMRSSVETSLKMLDREALDVIMIHSAPAQVIEQREAAGILKEICREGKAVWTGASVYGEDAALAAIETGDFDCLQVACSVLDRRPEQSVWQEALRCDVGIIGRSVLLRGALTDRYQYLPQSLDGLKRAIRQMDEVARTAGISLPELAYRYLLAMGFPHSALVGASSMEEVEAAVVFADQGPLADDIIRRVREVTVEDERNLNPGTWEPH